MIRFLFCLPFFKSGSETGDQEMVIKKFIRKNVKKGTSIEEVDKKICEKFGDGSIEYRELDYWYHQFYNGKKGLKDKRNPCDRTSLELLDLPNEMIHSIVSYLPIPDKFNLQLVSNRLGSLAAMNFDALTVNIDENSMTFFNPRKRSEETVMPINLGYNQLKMLLSCPELKLEFLSIEADNASIANGRALRNIQKLLKSIYHQLRAEHFCSFGFLKDQLSLLPYFNPEVLRGITAFEFDPPEPFLETIQELVKMEQWRQLKVLLFKFQYKNPFVFYPIEYFTQFEVLGLGDVIRSIDDSPEIFAWIRELIMTSPNIEKIHAGFDMSLREICETLDPAIEIQWDVGHDGLAFWNTPKSKFVIGKNTAEDLHGLTIVKENGKHWKGYRAYVR
ncbi:hypothetical protein CAEBREN_05527 [Caenorhabditis brenneri]|uniref:F-box domain-containing protein n=1 Tax=Caenorhabditis brenneri TaxID=135651 RepID=G0P054_CAEBE|nr:hypothetical protein CAEBREN_05527 [Caenorhabditis brenneri]